MYCYMKIHTQCKHTIYNTHNFLKIFMHSFIAYLKPTTSQKESTTTWYSPPLHSGESLRNLYKNTCKHKTLLFIHKTGSIANLRPQTHRRHHGNGSWCLIPVPMGIRATESCVAGGLHPAVSLVRGEASAQESPQPPTGSDSVMRT